MVTKVNAIAAERERVTKRAYLRAIEQVLWAARDQQVRGGVFSRDLFEGGDQGEGVLL
jgi:hypothetical protein